MPLSQTLSAFGLWILSSNRESEPDANAVQHRNINGARRGARSEGSTNISRPVLAGVARKQRHLGMYDREIGGRIVKMPASRNEMATQEP